MSCLMQAGKRERRQILMCVAIRGIRSKGVWRLIVVVNGKIISSVGNNINEVLQNLNVHI